MFTKEEFPLLIEAVNMLIASAKRQQNTKRQNPQFTEIYNKIFTDAVALLNKLHTLKDKK